MTATFSSQFVTKFEDLTNYDLTSYLIRYAVFTDINTSLLISFYTGDINSLNPSVYSQLQSLISEVNAIKEIFTSNSNVLNNYGFWELLDFVEETHLRLQTLSKISKYLRSARFATQFSGSLSFNHTLGQLETLEDVSKDQLGSLNYDDDWVDIAIKNDLAEEDYTPDGGNLLQLSQQTPNNLFLNSVIDNLVGERLYGKDLSRSTAFIDNDLNVLGYQDTFLQSVDILASLRKNSIPEFDTLGIDRELVGSNVASFFYATLIRQLKEVFATDDTVAAFNIKEANYSNTNLFITYEARSFYGITHQGEIKV